MAMVLCALLLLAGCPSKEEPSDETTSWVSESGVYTLSLETDPDPLVTGYATLVVDVPGATALSLDGGMTGMEHGFGQDPVVTGGDGAFDVEVLFSMAGTWDLEFALDGDAGADTVSGSVEVQ